MAGAATQDNCGLAIHDGAGNFIGYRQGNCRALRTNMSTQIDCNTMADPADVRMRKKALAASPVGIRNVINGLLPQKPVM